MSRQLSCAYKTDVLMAFGIDGDAGLSETGRCAEQEVGHRQTGDLSGETETSARSSEERCVLNLANPVHAELQLVAPRSMLKSSAS